MNDGDEQGVLTVLFNEMAKGWEVEAFSFKKSVPKGAQNHEALPSFVTT